MAPLENDPRLTAYVLGELDSADCAEVERVLTRNPDAKEIVREIESVAQRLTNELASDSALTLGADRTSEIINTLRRTRRSTGPRAATQQVPPQNRTLLTYFRPVFSAAAAVILAAGGFWAATPANQQSDVSVIETDKPIAVIHEQTEGVTIESIDSTPASMPPIVETLSQIAVAESRRIDLDPLFKIANELSNKRDFKAAALVMRQALKVQPKNELALALVDSYDQSAEIFAQTLNTGEYNRRFQAALLDPDEAKIPWRPDILYPRNWVEVQRASGNSPGTFINLPVTPSPRFDFIGRTDLSYGYQLPHNSKLRKTMRSESRSNSLSGNVTGFTDFGRKTSVMGDIPALGALFVDSLTFQPNLGQQPEGFFGPNAPEFGGYDFDAIAPSPEKFPTESKIDMTATNLQDSNRMLAAVTQYEITARVEERQRIQQQQRTEKISQLFETAAQLYAEARIEEAAEAFRQIQYIDPTNAEADRLLKILEEDRFAPLDPSPVVHNSFLNVAANPLSTFSIDVDTASYANVRRQLQYRSLPAPGAVRIEEFLNYFSYGYPLPTDDAPFSAAIESAACPWSPEHYLVRIGLRGWQPAESERPTANLVFLIDVSGSMQPEEKLPLIVKSLHLLIDRLRADDRIAIVTYAGDSELALPSTFVRDRATIINVVDQLKADGSTNGGAGINLAYKSATDAFVDGGINRVILCTDGDFNVGVQDRSELQSLIETQAKSGVSLSVLGFGIGNRQDVTLETLADRGDGNYAYIDTLVEAQKVLVDQLAGTLQTIAKDVKLQVEFNPRAVAGYRLLGYENRMLAATDFNDDAKDGGEIGAGHTVTAIYEVVPIGQPVPVVDTGEPFSETEQGDNVAAQSQKAPSDTNPFDQTESYLLNNAVPPPPTPIDLANEAPEHLAQNPAIDSLKYQLPIELLADFADGPREMLTLKVRYKKPEGGDSQLMEFPFDDEPVEFEQASGDFRFAAAVAGFAMHLRGTPLSDWSLSGIAETAFGSLGTDREGFRAEFVRLVEQSRLLEAAR